MKENNALRLDKAIFWIRMNILIFFDSIIITILYTLMLYKFESKYREATMYMAAMCGNIFIMRWMLFLGVSLEPENTEFESDYIFQAVAYNRLNAVKYLIKKGQKFSSKLVSLASSCSSAEMVELLLNNGGDLSSFNEEKLYNLYLFNKIDILKVILRHSSENSKTKKKLNKKAIELCEDLLMGRMMVHSFPKDLIDGDTFRETLRKHIESL